MTPLIADIRALMQETITIEPPIVDANGVPVYDAFGQVTYGPAESYRAAIGGSARYVQGATKEVTMASHAITVDTTQVIPMQSRVMLPEGFEPRQMVIQQVSRVRSLDVNHVRLYVS